MRSQAHRLRLNGRTWAEVASIIGVSLGAMMVSAWGAGALGLFPPKQLYILRLRLYGQRTIPYSPHMNQPIPHPTVTAPASELIDRLNWRYAAKKMDPAKAVPQDKVERILEAARLAPTSSGLQPYEIPPTSE